MARATEAWRSEIDALRAEVEALKAQQATGAEAVAEEANEARSAAEAIQKGFSDIVDQANEAIGELQKRLDEGTQQAGETVSQHPFATLASAFLLGLVIGRLAR